MPETAPPISPILEIYLQLAQYPILATEIRRRMRHELYRRGIVTADRLEAEARERAVQSQFREGLDDPFGQEDPATWEIRLQRIRDSLTDFYFAYNLPLDLFTHLVEGLIHERRPAVGARARFDDLVLNFNPELAPADLLIRKLEQYENLPAEEWERIRHHWEEINVVLIKALISDQLHFIGRAKRWFRANDYKSIAAQRIGQGKIGGKAAGMLLAWKILQHSLPDLADRVRFPRSFFLGADVFYDFLALNRVEYINQKYKTPDQIREDYPKILREYERGDFPEPIVDQLQAALGELRHSPIIVRSSSLLEDNFGTSFAGKYDSYFCANQGTPAENLRALMLAIQRIYASVYNPDALMYRRKMGLIDYDERMAILIQEVQGEIYRDYYFPPVAGVAYSRAPIVWNPRLRAEEGFTRLAVGLGTRAVDRVAEDYPRMVFLSHPQLRPESHPETIERYSQSLIDVIDLRANTLATRPVRDTLRPDFPALRWVASVKADDSIRLMRSVGPHLKPEDMVITFDALLQRTDFVPTLKTMLSTLEAEYNFPVDVEFTVTIPATDNPRPTIHLLQCRPQNQVRHALTRPMPKDLAPADTLFISRLLVPRGEVLNVHTLVYVRAAAYQALNTARRHHVARVVGQLNKALENQTFMLIGPGRWGSSNSQLGVPVGYADIYNASALVEVADAAHGLAPDPSYGTHFFQDLIESGIYPLAVGADDVLNTAWLESAPNALGETLPSAVTESDIIKVIRLASARPGHALDVLMDGAQAVAFFYPAG